MTISLLKIFSVDWFQANSGTNKDCKSSSDKLAPRVDKELSKAEELFVEQLLEMFEVSLTDKHTPFL